MKTRILALGVVGFILAGCQPREPAVPGAGVAAADGPAVAASPGPAPVPSARKLPRLVDLGAKKCVPCKQMVPVLEALTREYSGRLEVVFIDVWEDRAAGAQHGIRVIPTQILYDADGREFARHEGYWSKAAILARFREAGIALDPPPSSGGAGGGA